jgi:hypothetical protein
LARLPFSIVGDSAGISTWIGMVAPGITLQAATARNAQR